MHCSWWVSGWVSQSVIVSGVMLSHLRALQACLSRDEKDWQMENEKQMEIRIWWQDEQACLGRGGGKVPPSLLAGIIWQTRCRSWKIVPPSPNSDYPSIIANHPPDLLIFDCDDDNDDGGGKGMGSICKLLRGKCHLSQQRYHDLVHNYCTGSSPGSSQV